MKNKLTIDMLLEAKESLKDSLPLRPKYVILSEQIIEEAKKEKLIYKEDGKIYFDNPAYGKVEVIKVEYMKWKR